MKRVILILCVLLSFVFVGCNSSNTSNAEQFKQDFKQVEANYNEAMKKYNETYDDKYLKDAEYYLNKMKTMTGKQ